MVIQPSLRRRIRLLSTVCIVILVLLTSNLGLALLHFAGPNLPTTDYRSAVGAQEPRKLIDLDGVTIAFTESGGADRPVLLCMHAIGHGARDFEDLARRMKDRYRVIAFDFPGQGNSGPDRHPASATRYAVLLTMFIERLNLHSVTLIGNSIGGATAVRYASTHPAEVKSLVLCDSGGLGPVDATGRFFIGLFVHYFAAGSRGALWFPWTFARYYDQVLTGAPARQERERIVRSAPETAPILQQAWESFADPQENLSPLLPQIRCSVLLAWAKNDFILPLQAVRPAFDRFPNHRLEVFDGGHAAFLEDPDHFERTLRAFLDGI
jgi:pimeloyl-ACP methyl ester carboxylesterase